MMKNIFKRGVYFLLLFLTTSASAQSNYPDLSGWESKIKKLASSHPDICKLDTLGKTSKGLNIYALRIGKGPEAFKPGFVLVSGVDGLHPAGIHSNLSIAEKIITSKDSLWSRWREEYYFYVIPYLNPFAFSSAASKIKQEVTTNGSISDEDRDGRIDEDPNEDLNGDNFVSEMRVKHPAGNRVLDTLYSFLSVEWDKKSNQTPRYLYFTEGVDNDRDGLFNEDGPGGVNINHNFSFNYPAFSATAGTHAFSEIENRLVADYLFDRYNVYAVFTFGMENTLSEPVKHDRQKNAKRIITTPLEKDGKTNEWVHEIFKKTSAIENPTPMSPAPGSFSQWAYFHYGRFSYSSPVWIAPVLKEAKSTEDQSAEKAHGDKDKSQKGKKEGSAEPYDVRYVKWADSMKINDYFIPWTSIKHPDFPDNEVEVGGFKPYVRYNPPVAFLDESISKHVNFLENYLQALPKLQFDVVKIDKLEGQVYRVSGKVINVGLLPTNTELGDKTKWVKKIRHRVLLAKNQSLVVNKNKSFYSALQPGESISFQWLIQGSGQVTLEVGSPMTGIITKTIELK
jgi:hypothetical protein